MPQAPSAMASAPTGRLIRKMLVQPARCTSTPPNSGPSTRASALNADQPPIARARWRGSGNAWLRIGMALGISSAPAMPCTTRPATSGCRLPAQAHSNDPRVKVATLSSHIRRCP
ncbi:hypothetical protein G6F64_014581 [Rhizopus arrhizus]|uniref:Uncharacterized protein n=1 Tax=Rhizopus oryzae TaxID=64495 RepID=A0A9P7BJD1_RHIOR|nr:hypothetical protein G6F64_014581 [Rhizopus arrhizus]